MLLYKRCILVPDALSLSPALLAHAHNPGHEWVQKTLHRWRTSFNVHALHQVCEFVCGCTTCQQNELEHLHPGRSSNHCPFHLRYEAKSLWTSSRHFQMWEASPWSSPSWTASLSMPTSSASVTHTRQHQWHRRSSATLCASRVFPAPLYLSARWSSQACSGGALFLWASA